MKKNWSIGHSPHFDTENEAVGLYNVPGLPGQKFTFNEFHIHLGRRLPEGSEHLVDGNKFPMEVCIHQSTHGHKCEGPQP